MRNSLIVIVAASLLLTGCLFSPGESGHSVKYKVTGTASSVDVTLSNEQEGTEQYDNCQVPWTYEFDKKIDDGFLYISAQNQGQSGSVTVTIYVDGDSWKSSTSSGAYVIATASGSL